MDVLLKQRLVGAIVLVALGVIFIPMLLEGPNRTLVPEMDKMPAPETFAPELPLKPFPPVEEPGPAERAVITAPAGAETSVAPTAEPSQSAKPAAIPAPVAAVPSIKSPAVEKPVSDKAVDSWVVQVVSLSNKANALALRDKLRKGGFSTQVERVRIDGKTHYRVRVGPFLERAEADRARKQIADRFAQNGRVMSAP